MPGFKRARYLTCFFCGRKTSTKYTSAIRQFDCPACDATNYLDDNGDITDPPPSVIDAARLGPASFATPAATATATTAAAVFCDKCLHNQHLLTAALAQWLPDDPDDPDFAEREQKLYSYRRRMEKQYPQICARCEPRARARMDQAVYTAKTDLLRRVVDRSAARTKSTKRRSWLDTLSMLGWGIRTGGLALQLLWHTSVLHSLAGCFAAGRLADGSDRGAGGSWRLGGSLSLHTLAGLLRAGYVPLAFTPQASSLIAWATVCAVSGAWWNPQFVHSVRGFTHHMSGFRTWYGCQFVMVAIRLVLRSIPVLTRPEPSLFLEQLAGHLLAVTFTLTIFLYARRCIQVDRSHLFAAPQKPWSLAHDKTDPGLPDEYGSNDSLGRALDDIMVDSAASSLPPSIPTSDSTFFMPPKKSRRRPLAASSGGRSGGGGGDGGGGVGSRFPHQSSDLPLNSLSIQPCPPPVQYEQEMDWQPTQSPYPAFNNVDQQQQRPVRFGEVPPPSGSNKGPFWYRVPPAPTTPAERFFKPANQPRMRKSPVNTEPRLDFGGGGRGRGRGLGGGGSNISRKHLTGVHGTGERQDDGSDDGLGSATGVSAPRQVMFAEPSFFPQMLQNDPRNSLSDMFGQSFSLESEREAEREQMTAGAHASSWLSRTWQGFVGGGRMP